LEGAGPPRLGLGETQIRRRETSSTRARIVEVIETSTSRLMDVPPAAGAL
jgi:hypothetical protein